MRAAGSLIEPLERLFGVIRSGASSVAGLLRGKNDKKAKKPFLVAALAFFAVCAYQSLHALALAEREAAKTK